ncbi:MAG: hypothetical protein U9Q62_07105 [Campylobacterota bacterium]|nr:hypothetical protein [Campylobacterota bacterium]
MTKEEVLLKAKKQLDLFKAEIGELRGKASLLGEEAKKEFESGANELEELYKETGTKYDELQKKSSESWNEAKDFVELTNKALRHSFNYFISHYRKKG